MTLPRRTHRLQRALAAWGLVLGLVAGAPAAPRQGSASARSGEPNRPPPASPAAAGAADLRMAIPAGEFWMGRTRLWLMDEIGWQIRERFDDRPVHRVRLRAFWIDAHEVTNAHYAAFLATPAGAGLEAPYQWGELGVPTGKQRVPVYNVTWPDAAKYCAAQGGRLPSEAEWEYAARGGVADLDYPWGNDYLDEVAPTATPAATAPASAAAGPAALPGRPATRPDRHAHSGSSTGPVAVGSFAPNGFGLYDMSGNLWEWTGDWYDLNYYSESAVADPTGPATGRYKVIRGGSWADAETRLGTVYYRNFTAPDTAQPTIGFRCAASGPASR
ncbi:MAG: SUMF1/EgtB/PvdO family nonheme iron enzyme [Acidobacteriota bacterium]